MVKAFPHDQSSRDAWVKVLQRKDTVDIQNGGVYEKHFLDSDFVIDPVKKTGEIRVNKRLKEGAVPSVFINYPLYVKPKPIKQRPTQMASSQARLDSASLHLEATVVRFLEEEKIVDLDDLHMKLFQAQLPKGYR